MMSEMKLVKNNQQHDEEYAELDSRDYTAVKYQDAPNLGILFVCKGTRDEKFIARHEIGLVDVRLRGRVLWLISHSVAVRLRASEQGKTLRELARAFWDRGIGFVQEYDPQRHHAPEPGKLVIVEMRFIQAGDEPQGEA
jgi:hypothetical protein